MIKNIIFDIGGVILDDSLENISKIYGKDMSDIYKKIYSGNINMTEYLKQFQYDKDYKYIREILDLANQKNIYSINKRKL